MSDFTCCNTSSARGNGLVQQQLRDLRALSAAGLARDHDHLRARNGLQYFLPLLEGRKPLTIGQHPFVVRGGLGGIVDEQNDQTAAANLLCLIILLQS